MIGQQLGGYRVVARLGEGANGTVWKAVHPDLGNVVAIKTLPHELSTRAADRERFERGARAAARLTHAGIATVFGAEFDCQSPYIVSEFIDGDTVNALTAAGPLAPRRAVDLVLQAARALQYAHEQGVLHRDISGGNVMVTHDGHCKLVDFGLAVERDATRKTTQGTVMGTWPYMAPEALRDENAKESRDTYALGVILYQLLTGRLPFVSESFEGLVYRILNDYARPPSAHVPGLSAALDRLVLRVLEKDPKLRHPLPRVISELESALAAGEFDTGARRVTGGLGSRIDHAVGDFFRVLTTMAPGQVRRLATMAVVSVVTAGVLGWAALQLLPRGPVKPKVASLAVIPFFNESQEPGFGQIGHELAKHMVGRLKRLDGLFVQPYHHWVFGDAVELCGTMNVEGVLEGAFGVNAGRVEARVDLVKADGTRTVLAHTQSEGYAQAAEELTLAVAHGLKSRLTAREETQLTEAQGTSPSRNEAFDALSRGVTAHQRGDRDEALRWYEQAMGLDPGLPKAYVGVGSIHYDRYFRGKAGPASLELARQGFRQALALEPDNTEALRGLILVHYELEQIDSCLAIARQAQEHASTLDALLLPAWAYTLSSLPELCSQAVPMLERVVALDPMDDEAYWLLVLASAWSGQYAATVRWGDEFLGRFAEDPEVHQWLAAAKWRLGDMPGARHHFDRALELFGDDSQLYIWTSAGKFYHALGDTQRAREIWSRGLGTVERRITVAGKNPRTIANLCKLHLLLGHDAEFLRVLEEIKVLASATDSRQAVYLSDWVVEAYQVPRHRQRAVNFMLDYVRPEDLAWSWDAIAAFVKLDAPLDIRKEPQLAALMKSTRAYSDSILRRYRTPPTATAKGGPS